MGLLEDINSGKYNLVLFVVLFVIAFHQYWCASSYIRLTRLSKSKMQSLDRKTEPMANLDVTPQLKEAIKQVYIADVEAIRNLSDVANKLQKGGLTIPGNLTVTGSFNYLPRGTIVAWTGTTAPEGWALCNGQNGTPNLQGRFIFGWNPGGGKHAKVPGADYNQLNGVGGNQIHQLTGGEMPAHAHGMNEAGNHAHTINSNWKVLDPGSYFRRMNNGRYNSVDTNGGGIAPLNSFGTTNAGNHTHGIHNAGGNEAHNTMPPYYILAFIMKL
jgi:microcystin-dependent protein